MIPALNLIATILNATDGLVLAALVFYIISKDGIAYKKYLWFAFSYPLLQGLTASSVSWTLYFGHQALLVSLFRLGLGLTGQALAVVVAIFLSDFVRTLREIHDSQMRLVDERSDRMQPLDNIVYIADGANRSSDAHLTLLRKQGARSARHA